MSAVEERVCSSPRQTPVFGTRLDQLGAGRALVGSAALTLLYVISVHEWSPELSPSRLEIVGTATSLACVWLTRTQNIWSIIFGIVSVTAMGAYFFDIALVGQGWLHLGYYIPVQFIGWWAWLRAGRGRTDLPVRWLTRRGRVAVLAGIVLGTVALHAVFRQLHGDTPYLLWDVSIVSASVLAQLLLTTKRIESWWLWLLPIDVSAILLYWRSEAQMFAALYSVYLVLASSGLRDWVKAWRAQQSGLSAFEARFAAASSA